MRKIEPKRELRGLEKVCKQYGKMQCGPVLMVWDYANEVAVNQEAMPVGSERWKASEKEKWKK